MVFKKYLSLLLAAALTFTALPVNTVLAEENVVESEIITDSETAEPEEFTQTPRPLGGVAVDLEVGVAHDYEELGIERTESLPSQYLRSDNPYISDVKDQAQYGTCWAFSAMACAEAADMKVNGVSANAMNYSETHLVNFSYNHDLTGPDGGLEGDMTKIPSTYTPLQTGGNNWMSSFNLMAWEGVASESTDPSLVYPATDMPEDYELNISDDLAYSDDLHLKNVYYHNFDAPDEIKSDIMEFGAVSFLYQHSNQCFDSKLTRSYFPKSLAETLKEQGQNIGQGGHVVTIVGWDDNYSRENFKETYINKNLKYVPYDSNYNKLPAVTIDEPILPENDGAWLVKNSWGTKYCDEGFFWMSYENTYMYNPISYDYANYDGTEHIYQYDGTGALGLAEYKNGTSIANVFTVTTKDGKDQQLESVAAAIEATDAFVDVQVYTNLTDVNVPDSGTLVSDVKNFRTRTSGYYNIPLEEPVVVPDGTTVSVVVTIINPFYDTYYVFCDNSADYGWISFNSNVKKGQSFIKLDSGWADLTDEKGYKVAPEQEGPYNNRIKLYTSDDDGRVTVKFDLNGATTPKNIESQKINPGDNVKQPEDPKKDGYLFLGWDSVGGDEDTLVAPFDFESPVNKNTTIYAKWELEPAYVLSDLGDLNLAINETERINVSLTYEDGRIPSGSVSLDIASLDTSVVAVSDAIFDDETKSISANLIGKSEGKATVSVVVLDENLREKSYAHYDVTVYDKSGEDIGADNLDVIDDKTEIITVNEAITQPAFKVSPKALNLFYKNPAASLGYSSKTIYGLEKIELTGQDADKFVVISENSVPTIAAKDASKLEKGKQYKVVVNAFYKGFKEPSKCNATIKTELKVPVLKQKKTVALAADGGAANITLLEGKNEVDLTGISINSIDNRTSPKFKISISNNALKAEVESGAANSLKAKVELKSDDWTSTVTVSLSASVKRGNAKINTKASTLSLNLKAPTATASTLLTIDRDNYTVNTCGWKSEVYNKTSRKFESNNYFAVNYSDGMLTVGLIKNSGVTAGTYKVKLSNVIAEQPNVEKIINIKVINADPAATVKLSDAINLVNRGRSGVKAKVTLKNVAGKIKSISLNSVSNENFYAYVLDESSVAIRMRAKALADQNGAINTKKVIPVTADITLADGTVIKNVVFNVKPKQVLPNIKLKNISVSKANNRPSAKVDLQGLLPNGMVIDSVELNGTAPAGFNVTLSKAGDKAGALIELTDKTLKNKKYVIKVNGYLRGAEKVKNSDKSKPITISIPVAVTD